MNRLQAMQIFVAIADEKSFSRAAAIFGLARSSVTAIVQRLEDYLGVALIQRTTRRLTLTGQGLMYYRACKQVLHALDRVERNLRLPEQPQQEASQGAAVDVPFSKAVSLEEAAFILSPAANALRFF